MQDTVEVIINPDGKSCTTINQFGEKPDPKSKYYKCGSFGVTNDFHIDYESWLQAESERKTYEIENIQCTSNNESGEVIKICLSPSRLFQDNFRWLKIGSTHKAQIINNKAVIQ